MSTTPSSSPTGIQLVNEYLPLVESLSNAGLTIAGAYGVVPAAVTALVPVIEQALTPLFQAIANKSTKQQDIMAGWAASIGIWTAVANQAGLDPKVKARADSYIAGGQQATAKYFLAQQGFDPTQYAPVTPI